MDTQTFKVSCLLLFFLSIAVLPIQAQNLESKSIDRISEFDFDARIHFLAYQGDRFGVYDSTKKMILPIEFEQLNYFGPYLKLTHSNGKQTLYTSDFEPLFSSDFAEIQRVITGLNHFKYFEVLARNEGAELYHFIDLEGNRMSPDSFRWSERMHIYEDVIMERDPKYNITLRKRDGSLLMDVPMAGTLLPFKNLGPNGSFYAAVRQPTSPRVGLIDLNKGQVITEFAYYSFQLPFYRKKDRVPFILAKKSKDSDHLIFKPDGKLLSEKEFKVAVLFPYKGELYSSYFRLPKTDPNVAGFLIDTENNAYLLYPDYRMESIGIWKQP